MAEEHICISIYTTPGQATEALTLLLSAGFEGSTLSLLGRDRWAESQSVGTCRMGNALLYRGTQAESWQRIWSAIPGRGGIWFFEDGPLLMAGCVTGAQIMAPGEPTAPGAKDLETALTRFGVPEASAGSYASELSNHRLLLFVHGSLEETDRAQHLLSVTPATNHTLHHGASD